MVRESTHVRVLTAIAPVPSVRPIFTCDQPSEILFSSVLSSENVPAPPARPIVVAAAPGWSVNVPVPAKAAFKAIVPVLIVRSFDPMV